jgi:Contractile injection system tube protein
MICLKENSIKRGGDMSFFADPTRAFVPLAKLTAFSKNDRTKATEEESLWLPFDTKSLNSTFENCVCNPATIGAGSGGTKFKGSKDSRLSITFILDDSTYSNLVAFLLPKAAIFDSVDKTINKLIKYCSSISGKTHEPYDLSIKAFDMPLVKDEGAFNCKLSSMAIENKKVDFLGNRIRAEVKCEFVESLSKEAVAARDNLSSPDLTHVRQIVEGETLPFKTYDIYDSQDLTIAVAEFNQLDSLRELNVGDSITFPPIDR